MITIIKILVVVIGILYLVFRNKRKAAPSLTNYSKQIAAFKSTAEEIQLDLDFCQFRDSSFMQEVEQDNSDYRAAARLTGALVGSSIGYYYAPLIREETIRSVIFYSHPGLKGGKRFFQEFPTDVTNLKYYVVTDQLKLFLDKNDDQKYLFDFAGNFISG